ncbi:hypothetical protein [Rhodanobacter sp. DHG33]|uniref:hypothetical protein n=1 Tax=Rhodanobacter sp. DHG33 TaxID=2775921 RepID=UPI0017836982|nr:hypothetical protein [Rhodanobacter sp. DHG33]MBD8898333.1 hypothetical protein [Rhodanobacter sp. DHG33]
MLVIPVVPDVYYLRSIVDREIAEIKRTAIHDRTFRYLLRSSMIAKIKRAAIHGRTFQ